MKSRPLVNAALLGALIGAAAVAIGYAVRASRSRELEAAGAIVPPRGVVML